MSQEVVSAMSRDMRVEKSVSDVSRKDTGLWPGNTTENRQALSLSQAVATASIVAYAASLPGASGWMLASVIPASP